MSRNILKHSNLNLLKEENFSPTFTITYNCHYPPLHEWIRENHFLLLADEKIIKIYPNLPSVSYRQPRNLKQTLVRSKSKSLPQCLEERPAGCYKHNPGLSDRIRHNFTCNSKYLVYLITCQRCSCPYTGKTINHMHVRHVGHSGMHGGKWNNRTG
jgi:hypothetical protein